MAGEPAGTLFGGPPPGSTAGTAGISGAAVMDRMAAGADSATQQPSSAPDRSRSGVSPGSPSGPPAPIEDRRAEPTLWSDAETLPLIDGRPEGTAGGRLPEPADELDLARDDLRGGRLAAASIRLAVVLRLAPALAPAVLDALAGLSGPSIELIRGDALRLVGHERDARRAYATAAAQLGRDGQADPPGPA
jgi:hypothetical protein